MVVRDNFSNVNLNDSFFDSLKKDYDGFEIWFNKKKSENAECFTITETNSKKLVGFLFLKDEDEEIKLENSILFSKKRLKIGTLKLAEDVEGQRYGEGFIAMSLWTFASGDYEECYVTIFDDKKSLIQMLVSFGFELSGKKDNGECVYIKKKIAYKSKRATFPFISENEYVNCSILPIESEYHDTMFPYSLLSNTTQHIDNTKVVKNGVSKVFVSTAPKFNFKLSNYMLIYRKSNDTRPGFKSVVTGVVLVEDVVPIIEDGFKVKTFEEFKKEIGNKSVLNENQLKEYYGSKHLTVLKLLYITYFGAGNNINYHYLSTNGYWKQNTYPYAVRISFSQFKEILEKANNNQIIIK